MVRFDVSIAFDEVCAVVVLIKNSVQVLDFVRVSVASVCWFPVNSGS